MERNRVQERILSVAEDRCNAYKQYLRYDRADSNFWMGSAATVVGALGAITNSATTARSLSATAGALSGINAEYNQAYFGNLFYNVISKAIDERRREAYREIQEYGQKKDLADYPVEAAIKDAIVYDGMCSAVSAMEYAEQSVRLVNDPGLDRLNRVLVKVNQARTILEKKTIDLNELAQDREGNLVSTLENIRFGSRLGTKGDSPFNFVQSRLKHANVKIADFAAILAEIRRSLSTGDAAKLDSKKGTWEANIKTAFGTTFNKEDGVYKSYQTNINTCIDAMKTPMNQMDNARADMAKAQVDKQEADSAKAKHELNQAQGDIDKLTESVDFVTRHLDKLVARFIEISAKAIRDAKEVTVSLSIPSSEIAQIGQFDTTCGKLK